MYPFFFKVYFCTIKKANDTKDILYNIMNSVTVLEWQAFNEIKLLNFPCVYV